MLEKSEKEKRQEIGLELKSFREYLSLSRHNVAKDLFLSDENVADIEEGLVWNQCHAAYLGIYYEAQVSKMLTYILGKLLSEE